jgi:hypothetical protein
VLSKEQQDSSKLERIQNILKEVHEEIEEELPPNQ